MRCSSGGLMGWRPRIRKSCLARLEGRPPPQLLGLLCPCRWRCRSRLRIPSTCQTGGPQQQLLQAVAAGGPRVRLLHSRTVPGKPGGRLQAGCTKRRALRCMAQRQDQDVCLLSSKVRLGGAGGNLRAGSTRWHEAAGGSSQALVRCSASQGLALPQGFKPTCLQLARRRLGRWPIRRPQPRRLWRRC